MLAGRVPRTSRRRPAVDRGGFYLLARLTRPWLDQPRTWSNARFWLTWPVVVLLCGLVIRSSVDHRPANPASFALTSDPMVNTLVPQFGVLGHLRCLWHASRGTLQRDLRKDVGRKFSSSFVRRGNCSATAASCWGCRDTDAGASGGRHAARAPAQSGDHSEESLGATFVESLGGVPVTPEIEKLKKEGWWFEQLYATGTRSVRGIEAVTTGFQADPAQAVVKLSLAQRNFDAGRHPRPAGLRIRIHLRRRIAFRQHARLLPRQRLLAGDGRERLREPGVQGQLGRFRRRPVQQGARTPGGEACAGQAVPYAGVHLVQPFALRVSRWPHRGFYEQPKGTDNNAVKYTDWALGRFIEKAKKSDYWKDTLFLVVADHDIRVRGETLVPIERFHIPGLILGADIKPRVVKTVASQVDLPTTMLR